MQKYNFEARGEAGGEKFRIIIHVKSINNKSYIQQLRIERE